MADGNEPVGARARRGIQNVTEFYTATAPRPDAGGAYAMTAEEEREAAMQAMRDLQARRAARAAVAAGLGRPSLITNNPVGRNPSDPTRVPVGATRTAPAPAAPASSRGMDAPLVERDVQMPRRTGPGEDSDEAVTQRRQMAERPMPTPPRSPARRAGPSRSGEADRLNEISLALARGERPQGEMATNLAKRMGIEGYKKGGLIGAKQRAAKPVKKAAGGAISAKMPKVPGRPAGRPATTVKPVGTRPMAKAVAKRKPVPMPAFKKGGKVAAKKGKR